MIANKIIPSFYVIEARGDAARSMFPGDYGIEKVAFGTLDFQSDMHALTAADLAVSSIVNALPITEEKIQTTTELNPEFFPGAPISEEQKRIKEEAQQIADDMSLEVANKNKMIIPLTRSFDALGDFVMSRKKISGTNFEIDVRIVANVDHYVKLKTMDQYQKLDAPTTQNKKDTLSIH
jgi:hypothetical protein